MAEPGGGHEGAQHPLRTFAPPLAKFLDDIFFSDTIMYKGGKAIFWISIQKNPKKSLESKKIQKNPEIQKNLKIRFSPLENVLVFAVKCF